MRVKQLWIYVPLPAKLRLMWDRLTFSRLTTAYFVFSLLHCIIQLGLQIRAFTINTHASSFLYTIAAQAGTTSGIPALSDSDLRLCDDVAKDLSTAECPIVWDGSRVHNALDMAIGRGDTSVSQVSAETNTESSAVNSSSSLSSTTSASATNTVASQPPTASATASLTRITNEAATQTADQAVTFATAATTSRTAIESSATPVNNSAGDTENEDDLESIFSDDGSDAGSELGDSDSESDSDNEAVQQPARNARLIATPSRRFTDDLRIFAANPDGFTTVHITGDGYNDDEITLSKSCLWSLNYPVSTLSNTKREDVVFIAFQIWVLGMSVVALLNESIPHIFASLLTHVLATAWTGYQINHTAVFRANFNRVITNGACSGVPIPFLGNYWKLRAIAEFTTLAFNIVALLTSVYLTWKLVKLFGWQTFKRVGASRSIHRMYMLVLVMSIVLQLSMFFMGATVGLWIDNLFNGIAAQHAWYVPLYKATSFITMILLIPWIIAGWVSIRKELRLPMFAFLALSLLYLGGWSVMFLADTFRWTFLTWMFFRIMAITSVLLTVTAFVLGVICRYNFGKGLLRYLNAQEPLPGDDFTPVYAATDLEKVDFPSNEKPIPTFSAAFGKGPEVPVPSHMFPSRSSNGPRFFQRSAVPFESPRSGSPVTIPSQAMARSNESYANHGGVTVARSDSNGSNKSFGSLASYYSYSDHQRTDSSGTVGKQRWVIE
ncbi:hypothetical protein Moror_309 [Moniliophthora roreri MCA 2997]|uniref:Uncharacterized protein n=1 Tax=Moniliophthora roreri (strain MCA 2997) TaxID=1381753 RepID=V2XWR9_MONRO|nr:hypothetical protein Moror_309 [Moniliophthora roreri MCA 2997]